MTTVTIDVDDELYARARRLAEARKISVSEMLERMLCAWQPRLRWTDLNYPR